MMRPASDLLHARKGDDQSRKGADRGRKADDEDLELPRFSLPVAGTLRSRASGNLPGLTPEQAVSFLTAQGLQPDQIAQLRLTLRSVPETKGVTVTPTLSLVRSLSPEVHARLYSELGRVPLNRGQFDPFRYQTASADGWLWGSTIAPETRALVEPLLYRQGNSLYFADLELLRGEIGPDEFLRLAKVLNRRATYVLRVAVKQEEVDALSDYWGVGGRRTDIRAVLESMSAIQPEQRLDQVASGGNQSSHRHQRHR